MVYVPGGNFKNIRWKEFIYFLFNTQLKGKGRENRSLNAEEMKKENRVKKEEKLEEEERRRPEEKKTEEKNAEREISRKEMEELQRVIQPLLNLIRKDTQQWREGNSWLDEDGNVRWGSRQGCLFS